MINDDSLSQLVLCSGQDFCLFVFVFLFLFWTEWSERIISIFFNDFLCLTRCSSTTWMRDYQGIFGLFTGGWKRAFLPLTFLIIEFPWDEGAWLSKQLTCHAPFLLKISRSSRDFQSLCWELIFFFFITFCFAIDKCSAMSYFLEC